jgi:iron(III) transport system ATP-binding protein
MPERAMSPELAVEEVALRYGSAEILSGVSFALERGRVAALLGPSGSGKTTLLRAVAGLERPDAGRITVAGRPVFDAASGIDVPAEQRGLGFVFQSYALWPHRTVFDNVAYGLRLRRVGAAEIARRVERVLEALGLGGLARRYPHQLSGGQQQRVAIARALAYEPTIILLDEPLSNLDAKLRDEARAFLKELIAREERAAVIVTHDQVEALAIADTILLLNAGRIAQDGTPADLYERPRTLFAAEFIGNNVRFEGRLAGADGEWAAIEIGDVRLAGRRRRDGPPGENATAICRLERLAVVDGPGDNRVEMERATSMFLGERWEHLYRRDGLSLRVLTTEAVPSERSWIHVPRERLWIF